MQDLDDEGAADTLPHRPGDGYGAGGVLITGDIEVQAGSILGT